MGARAIGAGGGGPPMAATDRGRRTYPPGPLTLRYDCVLGAVNPGKLSPTGVGTTGAEKQQRGRPTKSIY
jgi:hypothetical protein